MKLSRLIVSLFIFSLLFTCKNPPADELIMSIDSLMIRSDSIISQISNLKTDTVNQVVYRAEEILGNFFEDSTDIVEDEVIYEINRVYRNLDTCLMACSDFNSELYFIHQQLDSAKDLYKKGELTDSAIRVLHDEEEAILDDILLRINERIVILNQHIVSLRILFEEIETKENQR